MNSSANDNVQCLRRSLKSLQAKAGLSASHQPRHSDYDLLGKAQAPRQLHAAAVLVPLVAHDEGINVLFTQRTDHLQHHPGQVSFPGGRSEPQDQGPIATALRETEEEIGLTSGYIDPLGLLDDYETVTGFLITPVVSLVTPGFTLALDDFEVAATFEVPLAYLLDPQNQCIGQRNYNGNERRYYYIEYHQRRIWGATAGMIMNLYRRLHGLSGPMRPA